MPELRGWTYPTDDSPKIRVRDLLTHTAGFVTDDPWGDRQTPLPEDEFTRLLKRRRAVHAAAGHGDGVLEPRLRAARPHRRQRLAAALQGLRAAARCSTPLGMTSTGYDVAAAPAERRALGYRWEDDAWRLEPTMAHGAFGAMGGIQTSANDYAKWVAFLLSAWPPRDGADTGPVRRVERPRAGAGLELPVGADARRGDRRRRLPAGRRPTPWA